MREIKFRFWNNITPSWVNPYDFAITIRGDLIYNHDHSEWTDYLSEEAWDLVIQQYTGVKDKDGKEIYEGDIIKYEHPTDEQCIIRNITNTVLIRWTTEGRDNHPGWIMKDLWGQYGDMQVIGNIFENPELLEEQ